MTVQDHDQSGINEGWIVSNVPFVSFVCDNDALYSMRFLAVGGGEAFGYRVDDFVDNKHYFAASTIHPDDQDIVDAHAEQAVAGGSPVVSRYRMVQADGSIVTILLVSKAVQNAEGELIGLAGHSIDLSDLPELAGPPKLLSDRQVPARRRPAAVRPAKVDATWAVAELPMLTFFTENNADYTVRFIGGSMEELAGYSAEEFVSGKYKPASTVLPVDQDIADAYIEAAAVGEDARSVARLRLLDASGDPFPVLIFARGSCPAQGAPLGASGGVLDIRHVPDLQGESRLLHP